MVSLLTISYRMAACAISPLLFVYVCYRAMMATAFYHSLKQRFGVLLPHEHKQDLIWIHAVSLGESKVAITVMKALHQHWPTARFLLTSMTESGYAYQEQFSGEHVMHQYLPYDWFGWVAARFVRHFSPKLAIFIESDWWPGYLFALKSRCVRVAVLNARMSPRSLRSYQKIRPVMLELFSAVDLFCTQDRAGSQHLLDLGVEPSRIQLCGNIKYDGHYVPHLATQSLFDSITRLNILAACTHPAEDQICFDAWKNLRKTRRDLLLIIAPRHIERAGSIVSFVTKHGYHAERLTRLSGWSKDLDVVVVDQMGCLSNCYSNADAVFLGGSFVNRGGHNPIEAALAARCVVMGPSRFNIKSVVSELQAIDAIDCVEDASQLEVALTWSLDHRANYMSKGRRAQQLMLNQAGPLQDSLLKILSLLQTS